MVATTLLLAIAAASAFALLARDGAPPKPVPNSLLKIDAETNEVVDVIPVGRNTGQVRVVGEYVFVSSEADKTLTRIAADTGEVTTSGASGADGGLAAAGERFVWATSLSRGRVSWVDAASMLLVDDVSLPRDLVAAFVAVGGGSLWVSYNPSPAAVVRYDLLTLRAQRRYPFASGSIQAPFELTYGLGAAWVSLGFGNALLRIDGASGETQEIRVGVTPGDPAVGFDSVWLPMFGDDNVWRIPPSSATASSTVNVGHGPFAVAVGAGSVWVANNCDGTVSRIDPASNEVVATIDTEYFPRWLDVGHGYVWSERAPSRTTSGFLSATRLARHGGSEAIPRSRRDSRGSRSDGGDRTGGELDETRRLAAVSWRGARWGSSSFLTSSIARDASS